MVRCLLLSNSNISELKFRLTKNCDFTTYLEKKTTIKGRNFKQISNYKLDNYEINIYGFTQGSNNIINDYYIPNLNEDIVLYGDLIACKFKNNECIDLKLEEYENFYIDYIEGNIDISPSNTNNKSKDNKSKDNKSNQSISNITTKIDENIDDIDMDDSIFEENDEENEDYDEQLFTKINQLNKEIVLDNDDENDIEEEDYIIDKEQFYLSQIDLSNNELDNEPYDYNYLE